MSNAEQVLGPVLERFMKSREPPKTFCPSEVARALSEEDLQKLGFKEWREAMPAIRQHVWERRTHRECEVLQRGQVLGDDVLLEDVRGPIRVRRKET